MRKERNASSLVLGIVLVALLICIGVLIWWRIAQDSATNVNLSYALIPLLVPFIFARKKGTRVPYKSRINFFYWRLRNYYSKRSREVRIPGGIPGPTGTGASNSTAGLNSTSLDRKNV